MGKGISMRKLLVTVALIGQIAVASAADNPKPAQNKKKPTQPEKSVVSLKVGDPAPPLKVSKWLQGEEVRKFEPGKVYIVEFWATWCGPCIWMMPHAAELQDEYRDRGVTFLFYTARDSDNTEEKVAAFVKRRGPKLKYTFAYADDSTTSDAWMKAAGREGVPCAFVVDKTGRIAYIGRPDYLGVILPKVIAGTPPQAVSSEVSQIDKGWYKFNTVGQFGDNKVHLQALLELEAKYPAMGNTPPFVRGKLGLLVSSGEVSEAKKLAEAMIAKAIEWEDPLALGMVSAFLRRGQGEESKELLPVAVNAAEARIKVVGDQDVRALIDLADAYGAIGDKAKAREYARKASPLISDKDAGALVNLATTYGAIGDKAEAREYARKAGQTASDKTAWLLIELANTYCSIGDKAKAREYADKAGEVAGEGMRDLLDLAKTYCALGDKAEAREYVRKAGQVYGDKDARHLLNLAKDFCDIGDKAEAREYARKASLLAGDNPAHLMHLASTYFALGDKVEAKEYARKAIAAATGEYAALKPYIEQAGRKFDGY